MNVTRDVPRLDAAAGGTVRDVVFDFLRAQGVDRVFGNPGSTELPLFANLPEGFGYVLGLQESVVVAMADGYAQATRGPAFVNLHSAAGLGHAMGSVYTAFRNRAPLVITTGQQSRALLPHDPFLFAESPEEFAKPYVKWASEPARAADVPAAIARAFFTAIQPPMGPVLVSVPLDDWDATATPLPWCEVRPGQTCDPAALDRLAARLDGAAAPALVVGPGLDVDGDWEPVVRLAERLEAEVWVSPLSARCSFPERHRLFAGFLPANQPALSDCLSRADLVLVLGAPVFTYHFPGPPEHLAEGTELWLVSDDPRQVAGTALGTGVLGSPRAAAEWLAQRTRRKARRFSEPLRKVPRVPEGGPLTAALVYQTLTDLRSPDSIVVEEAPTARGVLHDHFPIERPGGFFATASGGLGYGLPAAVGAALSRPEQPVIALIGDGSSMYSIQALWSAVEGDADLLVVVLNNGGYGALRQIAEKAQARRVDGCEIGHLDFVAIAEAQGCAAVRVAESGELAGRLRDLLQRKGPRLLEVVLK